MNEFANSFSWRLSLERQVRPIFVVFGLPSLQLSSEISFMLEMPSLIDATIDLTETPLVAMTKTPENPPGEPGLLDSWLVRNAPGNNAAHRDAPALHNAETLRETAENSRETAEVAGSKEAAKEFSDDAPRSRTYGQIDRNSATRQGAVAGKINEKGDAAKASTEAIGEASDLNRVNWLHDYAVYSLPSNPSRGRFFFQLALSPTVNYRNLSGGSIFPAVEADIDFEENYGREEDDGQRDLRPLVERVTSAHLHLVNAPREDDYDDEHRETEHV